MSVEKTGKSQVLGGMTRDILTCFGVAINREARCRIANARAWRSPYSAARRGSLFPRWSAMAASPKPEPEPWSFPEITPTREPLP